MARPVPETGQFETAIVDFGAWKRRALQDGVIDDVEGKELLQITEQLASTASRVMRSVQFVVKVLTCKDGLRSRTVREAWEERNNEPIQLNDFRVDDPEAA